MCFLCPVSQEATGKQAAPKMRELSPKERKRMWFQENFELAIKMGLGTGRLGLREKQMYF